MTKLQKVVIEVGGKKLEFSPEEAKELKAILSDLFGGKRVVERVIERDYWHWWRPYISYNNKPQWVTYAVGTGEPTSGYLSLSGSSWSVSTGASDGTVYLAALSK